jgi:hypothetical protein
LIASRIALLVPGTEVIHVMTAQSVAPRRTIMKTFTIDEHNKDGGQPGGPGVSHQSEQPCWCWNRKLTCRSAARRARMSRDALALTFAQPVAPAEVEEMGEEVSCAT